MTPTGSGANTFKGYTQGPGYWGKTFFIWPPDPALGRTIGGRSSSSKTGGSYPSFGGAMDDNTQLWDSERQLAAAARQLRDQLHRHPDLDQEHRAQSLPDDAPRRQHSLLRRHPHRRAGQRLRPYATPTARSPTRPAFLEGIHRLRARRLAQTRSATSASSARPSTRSAATAPTSPSAPSRSPPSRPAQGRRT